MEALREAAHGLPNCPGVYLMLDRAGVVLYVGKAKGLKSRVSQYFQDSASHNGKTRAMVAQVDRFDIITADSEFEALVLESSLIKRHQPRYNILLKDDKGYPYVRLDLREAYPKFSLVGRVQEDGARYFGPFGGRGATFDMLDALREALKLPTCRRVFPRDIGRERPCLNHHMGRCAGWCRPQADPAAHSAAMAQAVRLLEGKYRAVVDELAQQMTDAAQDLRFEEAARLRDALRALELLGQRQKVVAGGLSDTDVVGFCRGPGKSAFVVLHFLEGELAAKDVQLLTLPLEESDQAIVSTLVRQYYSGRGILPRTLLLPCGPEDEGALRQLFSQLAGRTVALVTPQRGAKADLIRLAETNAREEAQRAATQEERQSKLLGSLGELVGLDGPPGRIEAFDISHTGGSDAVASMTVFREGKPLKRDYRRFKLRNISGGDDYAAIAQVVERRMAAYRDGDEKFSPLPDLMLIDGGAGQVAAALKGQAAAGVTAPAFGMVKDGRHRTRALVAADGRELGLSGDPALFALIGRIQEETHRFAIAFHRQQQSAKLSGSELDAVPGIGPARRSALLKQFRSVKGVAAAELEELEALLPAAAARAVYLHFHPSPAE